ncbi:hypothetical protein ACQEVF_20895 [Nonomuraea polychroma]|uniref:hypothetical protein n=1 Tax=Nonomuraea polychroma TaxID=46176 RepID=UPI003D946323
MTISGRTIGVFAILVGLLLPVASCMATGGAYLPHQDPTPEIAKVYAEAVARADLINHGAVVAGALLTLTGVALIGYGVVQRRRVQRRTTQTEIGSV